MERAGALEGVPGAIVRHANVAHFGVQQAVHHTPAGDSAAADSGADGEIEEIGKLASRAPAGLAEGRSVHICVEADRQVE